MYTHCACGHNQIITLASGDARDILNNFLADVHSGKLTAESIQPEYYKNLAAKLTDAVTQGLGGASFGGDEHTNSLKAYLDHNVYAFSGAKSQTMLEQYNKLLLDEKGEVRSFSAFKAEALKIDEVYNTRYLEAEYNNAIASAQMAEKWQGLQAFKYLEYRTVGDNRVRPEHAQLDGLILLSTDPIWNRIYPPNAWACRCTVIPAADSDTPTNRDDAKDREKAAAITPYFKGNVGKEKIIYKDSHPYFKHGRYGQLNELDAQKNYGMQGVNQIYAKGDFTAIQPMPDRGKALEWWQEQSGGVRKSFDIKAADGLNVRFDNKFRSELMKGTGDQYNALHTAPDVLKKPDEIWSKMVDGKPQVTYIKYYEKGPVAVHVEADGTVRTSTMAQLDISTKNGMAEINKLRKGVLKFRQ